MRLQILASAYNDLKLGKQFYDEQEEGVKRLSLPNGFQLYLGKIKQLVDLQADHFKWNS